MTENRVRIGIVGAGIFGAMHLKAFSQLARDGKCDLVGFVARRKEQREQREAEFGVPGFTTLAEMIERASPNAITVVTPDNAHREFVLEAAACGIHSLSEKPLDTTEQGCREMIDACASAGVFLQVDFHKRYDPDHQAAQKAVRGGRIGSPLYGNVHMEDRIEVPTQWVKSWAGQTSPAWFLGVHFYDLARWILGSEPKRVYATGFKERLKNDFGLDAYDCINARVDFENGATISFDTSWILPQGFEAIVNQGIRLVGTLGMFEVDSQDRGTISCIDGEGMRTYNNNFYREYTDKDGSVSYAGYGIESILDFVYNVRYVLENGAGSAPHGVWAGGFDGLQATRMALAAHESIETGRAVDL
ncbi:MAG: Gfo/Idh/MocA family oxidoreductase [Armatimonadetes bacterium]|nr:Gfo/Idh/MocA family oxidoreductase [Armatimonadota bacterium]